VKRPPANPHHTSFNPQPENSGHNKTQYQSGFEVMMRNQSGSLLTQGVFLTVFFTAALFNLIDSVDLVDYTDAVSDRYFKKSFDYRKL